MPPALTLVPVLLALAVFEGCAHRTVTVNTDPPGALVSLYPTGQVATVTPGPLAGLRAGRRYMVRVVRKGYETTYAAIPPASGLPWPPPINLVIQLAGGYDSSIDIPLQPCTDEAACAAEDMRQLRLPR